MLRVQEGLIQVNDLELSGRSTTYSWETTVRQPVVVEKELVGRREGGFWSFHALVKGVKDCQPLCLFSYPDHQH